MLDTQPAPLTCSVFLLGRQGRGGGGAQHIPSGRAARPGVHPGAQPQAARTAPGSLLVLEGTDTAQQGPEELSFPRLPTRGRSEQESLPQTQPPTLSSTTGPESLPLASFVLNTLPIPHRPQSEEGQLQPQGREGNEGEVGHRKPIKVSQSVSPSGCDLQTKTGADRASLPEGWTHRNEMEPESGRQDGREGWGGGDESWGGVHLSPGSGLALAWHIPQGWESSPRGGGCKFTGPRRRLLAGSCWARGCWARLSLALCLGLGICFPPLNRPASQLYCEPFLAPRGS